MALLFKIAYCHLKINRRKKRYAIASEFYELSWQWWKKVMNTVWMLLSIFHLTMIYSWNIKMNSNSINAIFNTLFKACKNTLRHPLNWKHIIFAPEREREKKDEQKPYNIHTIFIHKLLYIIINDVCRKKQILPFWYVRVHFEQ